MSDHPADFEALTELPSAPTLLIRPVETPISDELFTDQLIEGYTRLVNFIDLRLYIESAQGFCHINLNHRNLSTNERLKSELFGYINFKIACTQQDSDELQPCLSFFETVRNEEGGVVGINWHTIIQGTTLTAGKLIADLITENRIRAGKALEVGKNRKKTSYLFSTLSYEKYRSLAVFQDAHIATIEQSGLNLSNLINDSNDFCPDRLFSLQRAQILMKNAKASTRYLEHDYAEGFPFESDVYQVQSGALNPLQIFNYMFPHLETKNFSSDSERQLYAAMHGSEDIDPDVLELAFDDHVSAQTTVAGEKTFEQLGVMVGKMSAGVVDIMSNPRDSLAVKTAKCQELQDHIDKVALAEFEVILTPLGARGNAPIAVTKYLFKHLETHTNVCLPMPRNYKNISFLAEWIINCLSVYETIEKMNITHGEILLYIISSWSAYRGKGFRIHHLGLGAAETSKSFSLMKFWELLIPGSYENFTYTTPKAFSLPGSPYNGMIIILEEAPGSMLGVDLGNKQAGGSKGNDGSKDGDSLSIMKDILTEGTTNFASNGGMKDGIHLHTNAKVKLEACFFFATNANLEAISVPIVTRCHVTQFITADRPFGIKPNSNMNPDTAVVDESVKIRHRMMQALAYLTHSAIIAKILPPINMDLADVVIQNTMRQAQKAGLNSTTLKRTLQRMRFTVESLVIAGAINTVFNIDNNPIANDPFSFSQLLLLRKHLVATTEHVSLAFGLLQSAYENPVLYQMMDCCKTKLFAQGIAERAIVMKAAGYQLNEYEYEKSDEAIPIPILPAIINDPRKMQYKPYENVLYDECYYLYNVILRKTQNDYRDIVEIFADYLYSNMPYNGRPSYPATRAAVIGLTKRTVCVRIQGRKNHVPALVVTETQIKIAFPCLDGHSKDVLRSIFEKVLCHPYAKPQTILWGKTEVNQHCPYMMPILRIHPQKRYRNGRVINQMRIRDPTYFNSTLIKQTKAFTEGVHAHRIEQSAAPSFGRVFASRANFCVNDDLDRLAVNTHLASIKMNRLEGDQYPAADPFLRQKQEIRLALDDGRVLGTYPDYQPESLEEEDMIVDEEEMNSLKERLLANDPMPNYETPEDLHLGHIRKKRRIEVEEESDEEEPENIDEEPDYPEDDDENFQIDDETARQIQANNQQK